MQTVCIDATWEKEITLGDTILKSINGKKVALFASVQFLRLDTVRKQLVDARATILETKALRTHVVGQVLGCDAYHDSFGEDIIGQCDVILYVGDGMFHPKALLLSQMYRSCIKPVLIWNPVTEQEQTITYSDIGKSVTRTKANLVRFVAAKTIGILVTTKPGQSYLKAALKLKAELESSGKKAYIFVDDTLQLALLEHYPFIDAWVNSACPRIGMDDLTNTPCALINIKEAIDPLAHIDKISKTIEFHKN